MTFFFKYNMILFYYYGCGAAKKWQKKLSLVLSALIALQKKIYTQAGGI